MARSPADEALLGLVRLSMAVSIRAADRIGGISPVQLRALSLLRESRGANLVALAEGLGVTVSTASRLVDRLIAAGLADRRPSPHTRREISLSLTPAGRGVLTRYDRVRLAELRTILDGVPAGERNDVVEALRVFVDSAPSVSEPSVSARD